MTPIIAVHAFVAGLALSLGGFNLARATKGDQWHRLVGRVWLALMYFVTLSSFGIREIIKGSFSPIHLLSVFTFVTITVGLWAARTGRIATHRRYMRGSYIGVAIAGTLAVAIPRRHLPQFAIHHPANIAIALVACAAASVLIVETCRWLTSSKSTEPEQQIPDRAARL